MRLTVRDKQLIYDSLFRNFTAEDLEGNGLLDRPFDGEFRRQLGEVDFAFFAQFYLPKHFYKPLAPLHYDLAYEVQRVMSLPGRVNSVLIIPRGFGKTTWDTLALPMWAATYVLTHYIVIASDASDQAEDQLNTLKNEFEDNDRILEDFGELKGQIWSVSTIVLRTDIKIDALGAGKKIRGRKYKQWRPGLIIFDDIENLEEVNSPRQRERRKKWFFQSAQRAGWEDTKTFTVGNKLGHMSLLADLESNPLYATIRRAGVVQWAERQDLWEEWEEILVDKTNPQRLEDAKAYYEARKAEMDAGGISAWPEVFPYYTLMVMRASEGHSSFATEIQNNPRDPSMTAFPEPGYFHKELRDGEEWYVPETGQPAVRLKDCVVFGFTDPSLGQSNRADPSAIIVLAKAPNGIMFIAEADARRRPPNVIISAQNRFHQQYHVTRWGIEKVAFQAFYAQVSAERSAEAGVYLPVVGQSQTANKTLRLQGMEPDIQNHYILVCSSGQDALVEQIRFWPQVAHEDLLDALEGARTLAKAWTGLPDAESVQADSYHYGGEIEIPGGYKPVGDDPYAKYDQLAEETIYKFHVAKARTAAEAAGRNPDEAEKEIPVPVKVFVPVMYL